MDNRKVIVACYIASSIVVWFLSRAAVQFAYQTFYQVRKIPGVQGAREVLPLVLAAVTFAILMRHPRINTVLEEVVAELKKVTWPGREEVVRSTTVVLVCIAIASLILAGLDVLWGRLIGLALGQL